MELKEFIKETITQIIEGVTEAQELIRKHGAEIDPKKVQFNYNNSGKPQHV